MAVTVRWMAEKLDDDIREHMAKCARHAAVKSSGTDRATRMKRFIEIANQAG